ncbi:MAG: selenocysteine-specific translation elongation factor [Nitrospinota bacterium]|nr:selenocysteine-specific translation elongation factor [Nitrospinota bacterium]
MSSPNLVIGTAGHIDHGKTSLIKAMTGVDCDRLAMEKLRGITIDLGFARLDLGGGASAAVVDVPGHRNFIHNMLAGAAGIDLALFVVAADDSVMPQTVEHMAILDLLGITKGVVALTKADLVDSETLELAMMEVSEFVEKSPMAGARVIPCSAITGLGLEDIRGELARLMETAPKRPTHAHFRMAVDRAFNMKGHGLVVTGTVISGAVRPDDRLVLSPGGAQVRVRRIQTHGRPVVEARAGTRAALNITGLHKEQALRGMILCHPAIQEPCRWFIASVSCHPSAPRGIEHGKTYFLHVHAEQTLCKVILEGGKKRLKPGETGVAGMGFETPIQLVHGDRFVLRSSSAEETLGGGMVLEPGGRPMGGRGLKANAVKWNALATLEEGFFAMVESAPGGYPMERIMAMFNLTQESAIALLNSRRKEHGVFEIKGRGYLYRTSEGERIVKELVRQVAGFHKKNPSMPGVEEKTLAASALAGMDEGVASYWIHQAASQAKLEYSGSALRLPGREQVFEGAEKEWREKILSAYRQAGLSNPPKTDHIHKELDIKSADAARIIRLLVRSGDLVSLAPDHTVCREALEQAKEALVRELDAAGSVETGRFRDILGIGRKAAIDILEHFDRTGLTRRVENKRVLAK